MTLIRALRWGVVFGVFLLAAGACGEDEDEGKAGIEVDDFYFKPTTLNAEAGKLATFSLKNEGKVQHTFTIADLGVDQPLDPGKTVAASVTPNKAGTFAFMCRFHPDRMKGTLQVK